MFNVWFLFDNTRLPYRTYSPSGFVEGLQMDQVTVVWHQNMIFFCNRKYYSTINYNSKLKNLNFEPKMRWTGGGQDSTACNADVTYHV
jgi:hypothetical protein